MTANSAFVMIAGYIPTLDGSLRPEVPARMIELFPVEMETIESALTELEEIKKRAEARRKECVAEFTKLSRSIKIALIDFIFKGETK
jgi:hypothetical protein